MNNTTHDVICGDCLDVLKDTPDDAYDLVVASPPYGPQRPYGMLQFNLRGDEWVKWAVERYLECLRVSRGLVVWVVNGYTESRGPQKGHYIPLPSLLEARIAAISQNQPYLGIRLWKSSCYYRFGIFGSGGKQKLRDDWESCVTATAAPGGRLPWSDNTACGGPPKYRPGGAPSYRQKDGTRVKKSKPYDPPARVNPGNVIHGPVGGGHMGHPLSRLSEAPYPLWLAERFVRSYCPPGGKVLDCFAGSHTTGHAAAIHGRDSVNIEKLQSQCLVGVERLQSVGVEKINYSILPSGLLDVGVAA